MDIPVTYSAMRLTMGGLNEAFGGAEGRKPSNINDLWEMILRTRLHNDMRYLVHSDVMAATNRIHNECLRMKEPCAVGPVLNDIAAQVNSILAEINAKK